MLPIAAVSATKSVPKQNGLAVAAGSHLFDGGVCRANVLGAAAGNNCQCQKGQHNKRNKNFPDCHNVKFYYLKLIKNSKSKSLNFFNALEGCHPFACFCVIQASKF
jgi:hypothetical protein